MSNINYAYKKSLYKIALGIILLSLMLFFIVILIDSKPYASSIYQIGAFIMITFGVGLYFWWLIDQQPITLIDAHGIHMKKGAVTILWTECYTCKKIPGRFRRTPYYLICLSSNAVIDGTPAWMYDGFVSDKLEKAYLLDYLAYKLEHGAITKQEICKKGIILISAYKSEIDNVEAYWNLAK